ncbi:MAG: 6-phosphofructokinase [Clostridia bacterium]|nr:6-phosphofructokinase [Clostridia bacterium]
MAKEFRRIGVLTSGGDAPGMNAALRAVTRAAIDKGVEVVAIYEGYKGLVHPQLKRFTSRDVSNIISRGGTSLYSNRCIEFKEEEGMQKAIQTCRENEIDGIVAIGGDGTFRGATDLSTRGIPTIGIPGTIDNDITSTEYSIGFDTAVNTTVEMIDRLRDTCESHARCNVVEIMGRNAGWVALEAGIATGASAIIIDEIKFDEDKVIADIIEAKKNGKRNFIVCIAEGVPANVGDKLYSEKFAKRFEEKTGIETKFVRLAHVLRGGDPTMRDRSIATQMGSMAVQLLLDGKSDLVVGMRDGKLVTTEIGYALKLDRMYKGTLKEGDLDAFTKEQISEMEAYCEKRREDMRKLYKVAYEMAH